MLIKDIPGFGFCFQDPSFVFTEEFQVEFLTEYHKVFDRLKKEFLVGEMVWNFADFMTLQRTFNFSLAREHN